jgi:hypothetical protein
VRSVQVACRALVVLAAALVLAASSFAQKPMMAVDKALPLSAEQTAKAIGLLPLFGRVKELGETSNPSNRLELVVLQQEILMRVTAASLQVETATGQIDAEIAETRELENYLISRRNSRVDRLGLLNLGIGGTIGIGSSALSFTDHDLAASVTSIVAGGTTIALSIWELRVQRGESRMLETPSNMLSEIFARPPAASNMYPPVVDSFMQAVPPEDKEGLSRQDRLIRNWVEVGRIPPPDSAKGRQKIDRLTSIRGRGVRQSIDDLDDRQAMLFDLRVRLKYIQQDLAALLASIPAVSMKTSLQAPP